MIKNHITSLGLIALTGASAIAADRDVQFINIIPTDQVLILANTGTEPIALDGWRFCSHNTAQVRRYTNSSALNGVTILAGESMRIHLNNDAPAGNPLIFNASDLGSFANFELDAFGLSFYFPNSNGQTPFGDGNFIADHLQWSLGGVDNTTADERSDEAEAGGVWVDQSEWISVRNDTLLIELVDPTNAILHSPADYNTISNCQADLTDDGLLNFFDISAFLTAFAAMDPAADFNNNELFNFFDVALFLQLFSAGCP